MKNRCRVPECPSRKASHFSTERPAPLLESLPEVHAKFCEPMLAELVETLPTSGDWQYEIKLDGYRAITIRHDSGVGLFSRRQNRMNEKYPIIAKAITTWHCTRWRDCCDRFRRKAGLQCAAELEGVRVALLLRLRHHGLQRTRCP